MIQAFSETPNFERHALLLYTVQMRDEIDPGRRPNGYTFTPLLKACVNSFKVAGPVQEIHSHIIKFGTYSDVYVGTTLIDSYSKCGEIQFARQVFDEMPVRNVVSWNSLISGYAKCGNLCLARKLFDEMPEKNLISWTSMISGYAQNGCFVEALNVFEEMDTAGVKPNEITLVGVLSACANLGALSIGRRVHRFLEENDYKLDLFVGSALIDMYSKCGVVENALQVYKKMPNRNVVSCSAIIVGLAMNGRAMDAIKIFEDMRFDGILPGDITFTGVLCACCHAGLVEKGQFYFDCMTREYSIVPKLQHYACMIDLLCRAGQREQAYQLIKKMPIKPDVVVWGCLLGTCTTHLELKLGGIAARQILNLDPQHSGSLVFLSYAFAGVGHWDGVEWVRWKMSKMGPKRTPGRSWIELNNVVHQFFAGDKTHPQNGRIYAKLDELFMLLEQEGYCKPKVMSSYYDIEEEEKEQSLNVHSEKIAIAFGLINTEEGTPIRIVKNLRVCDDCHSFIKLTSKIVKRDIVLRDNNRFHHFSEGQCSCHDYW
ncbi:hypothetical protein ACHQM5_020431 [Ranunculus cassubicifolius]